MQPVPNERRTHGVEPGPEVRSYARWRPSLIRLEAIATSSLKLLVVTNKELRQNVLQNAAPRSTRRKLPSKVSASKVSSCACKRCRKSRSVKTEAATHSTWMDWKPSTQVVLRGFKNNDLRFWSSVLGKCLDPNRRCTWSTCSAKRMCLCVASLLWLLQRLLDQVGLGWMVWWL